MVASRQSEPANLPRRRRHLSRFRGVNRHEKTYTGRRRWVMNAYIEDIDPRYVIDLPEDQLLHITPQFLKYLREEVPVAYFKCMSVWYVTRAADVLNAMS